MGVFMIKEACANYFHLLRHPLEVNRKRSEKILTVVAYISCITLIVPPLVGLVYGVSSLAGRIRHKSHDTPIKRVAGSVGIIESNPDSNEDESSTSKQTKSSIKASEPNREAERAFLRDLTPQMVDALGGEDYALQIPVIEKWDGVIGRVDLKSFQAPVMRGNFSDGRPFLLFCYVKRDANSYQFYVDCLVRQEHGWESPKVEKSELGQTLIQCTIFKDTSRHREREKYMLDRIKRLMRGEAVGLLKALPSDRTVLPSDAFLQKEELHKLIALDLAAYEQRPKEGTTGLFLCDPTHVEDSLQQLHAKFPGPKETTNYVDDLLKLAQEGNIEQWREIFLREVAVVSERVDKPLRFDLDDVKKFSDLVAGFKDRGLTLKLCFDQEGDSASIIQNEIARYNGAGAKDCVWGVIELFSDTENAQLKTNGTISGIPVVSAGVLADDQGNWVFQKGDNPDDYFEENRYVSMFTDLNRADVAIQKNSF